MQQVAQARQGNVVWRLKQEVATGGKRGQGRVLQLLHQARDHLDIGAVAELQGDARRIQLTPEACHRLADAGVGIREQAGVDMRGTHGMADAIGHGHFGHPQGGGEVPRAIVDGREHMAVYVNHVTALQRSLQHNSNGITLVKMPEFRFVDRLIWCILNQ